jgi:hypothetical protein
VELDKWLTKLQIILSAFDYIQSKKTLKDVLWTGNETTEFRGISRASIFID